MGYGAAGAVAAIEACRTGPRVLLVEKMPDPGGISILSAGGIRIAYAADDAFAYLQHTCGGRTPDDVLRALAHGMVEMPDYLRTLAAIDGAEVRCEPAVGNYPFPGCDGLGYAEVVDIPTVASAMRANDGYLAARPFRPGCLLFKVLLDNVDAAVARGKLTVWLDSPARRLLRDADGGVAGVELSREGRDIDVIATRAVILTCGGFEADEDLKRQYLVSTPVVTGSFAGNTGDGIRMAQQMGAALWHMWHYHGPYGMRHTDPSYPFGFYTKLLPMWTPERTTDALPRMAWIVVDQRGQRYVNEYPPYPSDTGVRQFDHFDPVEYRHTRLPSYLIFDEAGRERYPIGRAITNDRTHHHAWSNDNQREVDNGILRRADSLEALALELGIDADGLVATAARWNDDCARGEDRSFGRRPETMMTLSTPPYYAAALWPVVINTQGGPVHDARQRVIDSFGQPIARLYAAGELGSVFGHVYLAGGNLAECFVGGRIAGREAASLSRRVAS